MCNSLGETHPVNQINVLNKYYIERVNNSSLIYFKTFESYSTNFTNNKVPSSLNKTFWIYNSPHKFAPHLSTNVAAFSWNDTTAAIS